MSNYNRYLITFISAFAILLLFEIRGLLAQEPYSVMIDPGHPSENPDVLGACNLFEHEIVLEYGLDLWFLFFDDTQEPDDWFPYLIRQDATTVFNSRRVEIANNASGFEVDALGNSIPAGGVDYYFSIHGNSSGVGATGTEIFWYDDQSGIALKSRNAAGYILPWYMSTIRQYHNTSLGFQFNARSRGVKPDTQSGGGSILVLRNTIMPATLIELEFIDVFETCQLVSDTNGDYYIQGVFALYDANKFLRPFESNFVDFVIDSDVNFFTQVYGSVLMKNTTSGQVTQTHNVNATTLQITDDFGDETNVSIEKNLRVKSINGGLIDCGSTFAPITLRHDDGAELICDIGSSLALNQNVNVKMGGDNSCMLAYNGGNMIIDESLELFAGFIEVGSNSTLEIKTGHSPIFSGTSMLKVRDGATIKMNDDVNITIRDDAKLEVTGTSSNKATFTSADGTPSRSEWGTVYIYSDSNYVDHCIVEGSDWGLKFYGTPSTTKGNVVRNCTLRKNDQAIRAENTELDVYDCTIEDNRHAFVFINNTSSTGGIYLDGNTVKDNDRDGIYAINSVVDVFNTTLNNNGMGNVFSYHGIYASSSSDIALGTRYYSSNSEGYNTIINNHGAGIYRSSSSYVLAGYYVKPGTEQAGYNSIYGNGTYAGTYNGKDIYNLNIGTTFAHKIYWGTGSGPSSGQFYGPVDYSNWLTSPPGPFGPAFSIDVKSPSRPAFTFAHKSAASGNTLTSEEDTELKLQQIAQLKATIATNPNSPQAVAALQQLYSFVRTDWLDKLDQRNTIYGYLNSLYSSHGNLEVGKTALQLMIVDRQSRGKNNEAIALANTARTKLTGAAQQENLVNLVIMNLHIGQTQTAENLFAEFLLAYPNEKNFTILLQEMFDHLNNTSPVSAPATAKTGTPQTTQSEMIQTKTGVPIEFVLEQNYPNPFNPITTIRYQLPDVVQVTVKIYNIRGQEIRTLYDDRQEAGVHSVQWNGKTDFGETVASGVYVIHLVAGDFVATRKLAFMK